MKKRQRGVTAGPGLAPRTASMHHTFLQPSPRGLWRSSGKLSPRKAVGVVPVGEDTLVLMPWHSPASLSGNRKDNGSTSRRLT